MDCLFTSDAAPPAQLDLQQTTVDFPATDIHASRCCCKECKRDRQRLGPTATGRVPLTDVELAFRHSGWSLERRRVLAALEAARVGADRLDRFNHCGSDCVCEYSPSTKRLRILGSYCGDRFCLPCAKARSKKIERALAARCASISPLFMTLTLRSTDDLLSDTLDHLLESFRRLRQTKLWRKSVKGGVGVIEIKVGSGSGKWHVHLHVLAESRFIDAYQLSENWKKATGGSFIVDVQRVSHNSRSVGYVAKYASKGWTAEVIRDHDRLIECVCALRGRRLLVTFGGWGKLDFDSEAPDPGDWRRVGRLCDILDAARRGESWALGLHRALSGAESPEFGTIVEERPPPGSMDT